MRVLSLYCKDQKGGFSKRLYRLLEALVANGHELYYLSADRTSVLSEKVTHKTIRAPFQKSGNIIFWICFSIASFVHTLAVARKHKIERITVFSPFYTFLTLLPILLLKVPAVTFIRADNMKHSGNRLRNSIFYLFDYIGIRASMKIVFAGQSLARTYRKRFPIGNKSVLIFPNSIDRKFAVDEESRTRLRAQLAVAPEEFLLSTSGNINRGKNFGFLIEAIHRLPPDTVKLLIIGDESHPAGELQRLKQLTSERGLHERVLFCGWQPDPRLYIAASDLFVFPSRYEGSPNALLEALSCGVPCLGSKIEEIREILLYDELLFSLERPDELVTKIKRAQSENPYYRRLFELSEVRREHFTGDWDSKAITIVTGEQGKSAVVAFADKVRHR
ncbi:MAG: hypothetical protein AMJ54_08605 [Deltaproteobacteria bacterium SG8_13]|nr:MAG: hypothetical protein AMJ54_08605 [Deltaproteobacteria bacterium SG8_13]